MRASAVVEEGSGFDPSGSGGGQYGDDHSALSDHGVSSSVQQSDGTDPSSLSSGVRSLSLGNTSEDGQDSAATKAFVDGIEQLDDATKIRLLKDMFPDMNDYTISFTLKKCNGNWERAMEELLNHTFFEGQGLTDAGSKMCAKGVEAFSEDNLAKRRSKRKDKRRVKTDGDESYPSSRASESNYVTPNLWQNAAKDVEFIASRTKISAAQISSLYHKNGASLPTTIATLLDLPSLFSTVAVPPATDPIIVVNAFDLGKDFPSILPTHLTSLIRLTHPSTAAAHELAKALSARRPSQSGGLQVITHYTPLHSANNTDSEDDWTPVSARTPNTSSPRLPMPHHFPAAIDPVTAAHNYNTHAARAFSQASAAHRKGKSDRLMGAAAGYYSQVGRDYATLRTTATSAAADELVAQQSTRGQIDLHGTNVKDAVRIARSKTEDWWKRGGGRGVLGLDGRVERGVGTFGQSEGLRLITGLGRHSEGGRAKIGPAVGRMLAVEGWRFVVDEGVFVVTGKSR